MTASRAQPESTVIKLGWHSPRPTARPGTTVVGEPITRKDTRVVQTSLPRLSRRTGKLLWPLLPEMQSSNVTEKAKKEDKTSSS